MSTATLTKGTRDRTEASLATDTCGNNSLSREVTSDSNQVHETLKTGISVGVTLIVLDSRIMECSSSVVT